MSDHYVAFMQLPPPHDDDAAGWKELAFRRGEEYNRLADRVAEAWAVLARVRVDIQRQMRSDDATDAPYNEDLARAIGAIDAVLGDGPSDWAGYTTVEEAREARSKTRGKEAANG